MGLSKEEQEIVQSKEFQEYWQNRRPIYTEMKYIYIAQNDEGFVRFGVTKHSCSEKIAELGYSSFSEITDWFCNGKRYSNADILLKQLCKIYEFKKYKGQWFSLDYNQVLHEFKIFCIQNGDEEKRQLHLTPTSSDIAWYKGTDPFWNKLIHFSDINNAFNEVMESLNKTKEMLHNDK